MDIEAIIREYIDKSLHMSLATVSDNKPWVSEVYFVYNNDLNLYWRSLATRRHSVELQANPYVAGNIVRQHSLEEYPHAVYFEGLASQVESTEEIAKILPLFTQRLKTPESALDEARTADGHKFYKINVSTWYAFGKFGNDSGQKHTLAWHS